MFLLISLHDCAHFSYPIFETDLPEKVDAFWCAPGDGQFEIDVEVGLIVILAHAQSPRKTKVGDLHFVFRKHQNVSED